MSVDVEIVAPASVSTGETLAVTVRVTVTGRKAVDVRSIVVRIHGNEAWAFGDGRTRRHAERYYLEAERRFDGGELAPGVHEYSFELPIPSDAPPTHDTTPASAWLRVVATVDRPFPHLDVLASRWFDVRRVTREAIARRPHEDRARGGEFEVSVASTCLAIGEPIVGWIATAVDHRKPITVKIYLVAITQCRENGAIADDVRYQWRHRELQLPANAAGRAFPFELALPAEMPPTFRGVTHSRSWVLVITTPAGFLRDDTRVEIPLEIHDLATRQPVALDAPAIGREHLPPVFAGFAAAHDWEIVGDDVVIVDPFGILRPVVRRIDGLTTSELGCGYDERGLCIVARARHPALAHPIVLTESVEWVTPDDLARIAGDLGVLIPSEHDAAPYR